MNWRRRVESLPISGHLGAISSAIDQHRRMVLRAPPGSGKTTVLPLHLSEEPWLVGRKIMVLQPRRLAAKSVAARMSDLVGDRVGETVGYHVRLEARTSPKTRIEIVTEGLLTRRLVSEPDLPGVGLVIFDEFHERSLHADMALALTLETASALRPDLRVLVMSATLGQEEIFADFHPYEFSGTAYPVEVVYRPDVEKRAIWERTARAVLDVAPRTEGDVLAFLPGAGEIERAREWIERQRAVIDVLPLYGELPYEEQQRAIAPSAGGRRRAILATPIAETSLTIDGVTAVVDSGYHKISRYDDDSGMSTLVTERISRDSADQRAGRAGRTAPGICVRLWGEGDHFALRAAREPEVLRADLSGAVLDLAVWGTRDPKEFAWITKPPPSAIDAATGLLELLGAIHPLGERRGSATELGLEMSKLGTHPRLARLAIAARSYDLGAEAAQLITILEERDALRGRAGSADIHLRTSQVEGAHRDGRSNARMRTLVEAWTRRLERISRHEFGEPIPKGQELSFLLAIAFPDRIAKRRGTSGTRYLLSCGKGGALDDGDTLQSSEFLVVAEMQQLPGRDGRIVLAARLEEATLRGPLRELLTEESVAEFDEATGSFRSSDVERVGAIVVKERLRGDVPPEKRLEALLSWLSTDAGFARLPRSDHVTDFLTRANWARSTAPDAGLPDLSEKALQESVRDWLGPFVPPSARLTAITEEMVLNALRALLSWEQLRRLDDVAPPSLQLPAGKIRTLVYSLTEPPRLDATIQELFGWPETPRIGSKRIPALIHILSPARRPIQVTRDLASFWKNGYPEVRKELRGRYPKHKWPENP